MLTISKPTCKRDEVRAGEHSLSGYLGRCSPTPQVYEHGYTSRRFPKSLKSAAYAFLSSEKRKHRFYTVEYTPYPVRKDDFSRLVNEWLSETRMHSSLSKKFMHPAYQTIMAMGKDALPFILALLQKAPGHWFYALRFIARKDVAESANTFAEAREMWLNWGKENRLIK